MMKKMLIAIFAAAAVAAAGLVPASAAPAYEPRSDAWQDPAAPSGEAALSRMVNRVRTTREFLKAAARIVAESGGPEAVRFMELAVESESYGNHHYENKEYEFAADHMNEALHMAVYAITIARSDDKSVRDIVMRDAIYSQDNRDNKQQETAIRKKRIEVASFILAAERILSEKGSTPAKEKLDMARDRIETSRKFAADGNLDAAIEEINRAYTLATQSIKEMKETERFSVTFPKTEFANEKEEFRHESKKNDTYLFFAEQIVPGADAALGARLDDARSLKKGATELYDAGKHADAIARIKESTGALIKLIKDVSNR